MRAFDAGAVRPNHRESSGGHTLGSTCALLASSAVLLAGCSHDVYSPPARMLPLESAAALRAGQIGLQVEGATHGVALGVSAETGTLRARTGVAEGTDASAEVSILRIDGSSAGGTFPDAFAGRVGVKHELRRWLSIAGGAGGGASAGGGFVSPDVAVIVAAENPYVVPFLSLRGSFSAPFDRHSVDTGKAGADAPGRWVYTPPFTWIAGGIGGIRVPLPVGAHADRPPEVSGSLLVGLGYTWLAYDGGPTSVVGSLGAGGEIVF